MEMKRYPNDGCCERLHLDVCVDERTPRHGTLELLKKLRPEWKPEDIQIKASSSLNLNIFYVLKSFKT